MLEKSLVETFLSDDNNLFLQKIIEECIKISKAKVKKDGYIAILDVQSGEKEAKSIKRTNQDEKNLVLGKVTITKEVLKAGPVNNDHADIIQYKHLEPRQEVVVYCTATNSEELNKIISFVYATYICKLQRGVSRPHSIEFFRQMGGFLRAMANGFKEKKTMTLLGIKINAFAE